MRNLYFCILIVSMITIVTSRIQGQTPATYQPVTPMTMPGTPVGKSIVPPAGTRLPTAVPKAGAPVGSGPGGMPKSLDPQGHRPPGEVIDLKNVIAPYPGQPKPEKDFWEKLEDRWFALFQSEKPAVRPTNFTPGIGRRNRERAEERRQRAWWQQ